MLDEAYFAELNIFVAETELKKNWNDWLKKHDLDTKFILYYGFLNAPWFRIRDHWSIIFYTHGGN